MNNCIGILLIFILILYGCATASPKDTKKGHESTPVSAKIISAKDEIPLDRQYLEKGRKSAGENKYDEALEYFLKADKEKPDDEYILFEIGAALRHLSRSEEALEYFHRVVGINPKSSKSLRNIGTIQKEREHDPEAIEAFTKLLDIEPKDEVSIVSLADLYFKAGDYETCYTYISTFYQNLGDYNVNNTSPDGYKRIKSIFERFSDYITVIDNEQRKKKNKVKYAY